MIVEMIRDQFIPAMEDVDERCERQNCQGGTRYFIETTATMRLFRRGGIENNYVWGKKIKNLILDLLSLRLARFPSRDT